MSYEEDNESGSDHDFGDLFGSEDEASDIDDGRSQSSAEEQDSPAPVNTATKSPPPATSKSNDLDNLFGSDDESESEQEVEKRQTLKQRSSRQESSEDEDTNRKSPARYDDDDEEREEYDEYDNQSSRKQRVEVSLEMPQLPVPYSDNNKYYLAKLPRFLDIEVNPYDREDFEVQVEEGISAAQEQEAIREQIESTIRWRRVNVGGFEEMQSNAHIVEWEDGRKSLMLGDECFDISTKPVGNDDHSYLLAHQTESGALESQTEFTDHMTFMPSGLKSDTHRNLTAQIAHKQVKKNKTKMYFTEKDPELMKQELESQENERLRAQKKLEIQRRKMDQRYGDSGSSRNKYNDFGNFDTTDYPSRGQQQTSHSQQDRYEDDFVVDDDEYDEEEERSREDRLSQAKRSNMDKYSKRAHYSDDEEEEEEEEDHNDDDDEEEEIVVRRHKRNRIMSDDDE